VTWDQWFVLVGGVLLIASILWFFFGDSRRGA
jgi:hypothetical protein